MTMGRQVLGSRTGSSLKLSSRLAPGFQCNEFPASADALPKAAHS